MRKIEKDFELFYPESKQDWRNWLQENHKKKQAVWVVCYKKNTGVTSITWSEIVDEALCFGWIDGIKKNIDAEKYKQYVTKRKANSIWSKINKQKVEQFINEDLMTKAGLESIEIAKQNGSWSIYDEVEDLIIPEDLEIAFKKYDNAKEFYLSLSDSIKKQILAWLVLAKRAATRQKRIQEIVESASQGKKPKHIV